MSSAVGFEQPRDLEHVALALPGQPVTDSVDHLEGVESTDTFDGHEFVVRYLARFRRCPHLASIQDRERIFDKRLLEFSYPALFAANDWRVRWHHERVMLTRATATSSTMHCARDTYCTFLSNSLTLELRRVHRARTTHQYATTPKYANIHKSSQLLRKVDPCCTTGPMLISSYTVPSVSSGQRAFLSSDGLQRYFWPGPSASGKGLLSREDGKPWRGNKPVIQRSEPSDQAIGSH